MESLYSEGKLFTIHDREFDTINYLVGLNNNKIFHTKRGLYIAAYAEKSIIADHAIRVIGPVKSIKVTLSQLCFYAYDDDSKKNIWFYISSSGIRSGKKLDTLLDFGISHGIMTLHGSFGSPDDTLTFIPSSTDIILYVNKFNRTFKTSVVKIVS